MPVETWLIFITGVMILGSLVALELKDILSSIVAIGVVGLGVSLAFLFLQAPDLAIVQFLFEILALIVLIRAFVKKECHAETQARVHPIQVGVVILVLTGLFLSSIWVFHNLPPFGEPLMSTSAYYLENGVKDTGAVNLVASIILDYRAYDTLGEVTVLFTSILGAITILSLRSKKSKENKS